MRSRTLLSIARSPGTMPAGQERKARQAVMVDDEPETLPSAEEMAEALERMPAWQVDGTPDALPHGENLVSGAEETPAPVQAIATEIETSPPALIRILEALLFIGGPSLTAERAAESVRGLSEEEFQQ